MAGLVQYKATAVDGVGNVLAAASVAVRRTIDDTAAIIYSDDGVTLIPGGTFTADGSGDFEFWALPGEYQVTLGAGASPQEFILTMPEARSISRSARSELSTELTNDLVLPDGALLFDGTVFYVYEAGSTAIPDMPNVKPVRPYTPDHFGAVRGQSLSGADSLPDSYAAFIALRDFYISENLTGDVTLFDGYYRVSQTLDWTISGLFIGKGARETFLHGNFTSGPLIRFYDRRSGFDKMGFTGGAARQSAPSDLASPAVLFEGEDSASTSDRSLFCTLSNAYFFGHPGSGVHVVGPAFTGDSVNCQFTSLKGHGISFDRGQAVGRTNLITALISGIIRIKSARFSDISGHAVACGSDTDNFSTPSLRVVIDNVEGGDVCQDPAVRYAPQAIFLRGANYIVENCGLESPDGLVFAAGRNIHLTNNRILGNTGTQAYVIGTYDTLPTEGVYISGINVVSPTSNLTAGVTIALPAGETTLPKNIHVTTGEQGNMDRLVDVDGTITDLNLIERLHINGQMRPKVMTADQTVNSITSFTNITDLEFPVEASEEWDIDLVCQVDGDSNAEVKFQFIVPSGATLTIAPTNSIKVTTGNSIVAQNTVGASAPIVFDAAGAGNSRLISFQGRLTVGVTSGDFQTRFGQVVSDPNDTTIKQEATRLKMHRVV